jgi:beta-lactamase superfamily II metal-dependent hydrolase
MNHKPVQEIIFLITLLCTSSLCLAQGKVGDTFPEWSEGYLDIHHINTGKGESSFFILPDGTTMLVDAGVTERPKPRVTDSKPDGKRTPGEWISRYILKMIQVLPDKKLNYILLTHFHNDHMGYLSQEAKISKSGNYKLSGITEVGENIPFDNLVDRAWPDYDWPVKLDNDNMKNYQNFLKWQIENNKVRVEKFKVGYNSQFVLVKNPEKFPDFEIRNIAANGHVWTGFSTNERNHFPELADILENNYPSENMCSIAFRLSYGKFDYFNGGDLTAGEVGQWQDIENPVGLATGPVDVCMANHHAYYDAMSTPFLRSLRPRIHIIMSWSPSHPSSSALSRMLSTVIYPGPRSIFATNVMDETKIVIGSSIDTLLSKQGHIVIRVNPGGGSYLLYILEDSEENFRIKAMHGPYECN